MIKNLWTTYQTPKIDIYISRNACIYSEGFIVTIISEDAS